MGLFHKYLIDAGEAAAKGEYDKAVQILEEHQLNHVNKSEDLYGVIQRIIDSLNLYSQAVNQATTYAREKKLGGIIQQIGVAEVALRRFKKDIKNLLDKGRIKLE